MSQLLLANHAHVCVSGDQVVILDLRRDKYSCFDLVDASPLSNLVPGWPISSLQAATAPITDSDEAVRDLLNAEILTTNYTFGREVNPIELNVGTDEILQPRSVFDDHSKPRHPISTEHRTAFFSAIARTKLSMRMFTLERVLSQTARRREQAALTVTDPPSKHIDESDQEALRVLVANYRWLRPWGYTSKDRCLFGSLALAEYLAAFGVYPDLVIGVKTAPFAAHCWVQLSNMVLNDYAGKVREYTPIMAV